MDRVVFVTPSYEIGGSQRVLLTLLANVDRMRITPELVVLDAKGGLRSEVPPGVPVHDLRRPRLRAALPRLFTTLREIRPGAIFSTLGYVNLAILAMRPFLSNRPRVIIRESNIPSQSLPSLAHPRILAAAYRFLYHRADHIICQSPQMEQDLVGNFGVDQSQVHQLPNPVDVTTIRAACAEPTRVPGEGLRLVAAGHLIQQKGYDRLLEMFTDLRPDAHLTIFGDGKERGALEAQIEKLGIAGRVDLPGFETNLWPAIAGADAFLMPSRWEGLPNAALEALACGVPVVATPSTGGLVDVAARAQEGAVTLVTPGTAFIEAIGKCEPRNNIDLRTSLLPDEYSLPRVATAFNDLLT